MKTHPAWFVAITLVLAASAAPANVDPPMREHLEKGIVQVRCGSGYREVNVLHHGALRVREYDFELAPWARSGRVRVC